MAGTLSPGKRSPRTGALTPSHFGAVPSQHPRVARREATVIRSIRFGHCWYGRWVAGELRSLDCLSRTSVLSGVRPGSTTLLIRAPFDSPGPNRFPRESKGARMRRRSRDTRPAARRHRSRCDTPCNAQMWTLHSRLEQLPPDPVRLDWTDRTIEGTDEHGHTD